LQKYPNEDKKIPHVIPIDQTTWQPEDIDVFDKSDAKAILSFETTGEIRIVM
jgi:hypothetical protein